MTKRFWAGLMLFSIFLTTASASYLVFALREKATVEVPLKKTKALETEKPIMETKEETVILSTGAATTEEVATKEVEPPPAPVEVEVVRRNILFSLHSSSAKNVYIVGDFNRWYREPMIKKGAKSWTIAKKLEPGIYNYMYIINGRRVRDPNNKNMTKDGKSVLTVKPI